MEKQIGKRSNGAKTISRFLGVVCATVMFAFVMVVSTWRSADKETLTRAYAAGRIPGVDYSRIGAGKGYKAVLKLGKLEFMGDFSRGTTLSKEEQDAIIRQVMLEMKLTTGMLKNAEKIISDFQKMEGFNLNDVKRAIFKLTGVDTVKDLLEYAVGVGEKSSGQVAAGVSTNAAKKLSEKSMKKVVTKGGTVALKGGKKLGFKGFFLIPDLFDIGIELGLKNEKIKEKLAEALDKSHQLDLFYDECNKRIAKASGDDGEWKVRFENATATHQFKFWGIGGLLSEWALTGEIVRGTIGRGEDEDVIGNYEGTLLLEMRGLDMRGSFDQDWAARTTLYPSVFNRGKMTPGGASAKTNDKTVSETVLKRSIEGEFNFYMPGGSSGLYEPTLFGGFDGDDNTTYSFSHTMSYHTKVDVPGIGSVQGDSEPGKMTSNDVNTILLEGEPVSWDGSNTLSMDVGTVWEPLDSKPKLQIYFE